MNLIHVLNKIKVPLYYELYVCNTVRKLCQLRDNMYSCDIYKDMTDINAMLNEVYTEWPFCFICFCLLDYCMEICFGVFEECHICIYL